MKIQELIALGPGSKGFIQGLIVSKQELLKRNGEKYLLFKLQDSTGQIEMPIWSFIDRLEHLNVGDKISVSGLLKDFNDTPQISLANESYCDTIIKKLGDEVPLSDFVPAYEFPDNVFDKLAEIISKIQDKRYHNLLEEILGVIVKKDRSDPNRSELAIKNQDKWNLFIQAPAAVRHHGNKIGGLFMHSLGVAISVESIIYNYAEEGNPFFLTATKEKLNTDLLRFAAIIHDYHKTTEYKWELGIERNEDSLTHEVPLIGTLAVANSGLQEQFSLEELSKMYEVVLLHHGQWGRYQPTAKDKVSLEATLLHIADMVDSQIVGAIEKPTLKKEEEQ